MILVVFLDARGQFFSPDLIVAVAVFVFALMIFFSASNSIFSQVSSLDERRGIDEAGHLVTNELVLSGGQPSNWENMPLDSAFSLGLAQSDNSLSSGKAVTFVHELNDSTQYPKIKEKLGLGPFDLYFRLVDSSGAVISYGGSPLAGGVSISDPQLSFSYKRLVLFNGSPAVLDAVLSLAK